MSVYSYILAPVAIKYKSINTKYAAEEALEDVEDDIKMYENIIKRLAWMTEPAKFCGKDEDPQYFIQSQLEEALSNLPKLYVQRRALSDIIEHWNESHTEDGLAIKDYEGFISGFYRTDGDFIKTTADSDEEDL